MKTPLKNSVLVEAPKRTTTKDPGQDSWRDRISVKLLVGILLFFLILSSSAYFAMRLHGREVIAEQSDKLTREVGRKLVLQLQEHIEASETLARTEATLGETLPRDVALYKTLLPKVIISKTNAPSSREAASGPSPDNSLPVSRDVLSSGAETMRARSNISMTTTPLTGRVITTRNGTNRHATSIPAAYIGRRVTWTRTPSNRW